MISIIGLDLDACMIRFLVSIPMHAAGSAAARAAATVVFSPSWDLAAMHTGGGSRPERGGSGSEFSLGMQTRQRSCRDNHLVHAVRLAAWRRGGAAVFSNRMSVPIPFEVIQ